MSIARRYTNGKIRYELIPDSFLKELAKVYTIGADKYSLKDEEGKVIEDGADNWRKGLSWKQTIGAIYRHLEKFKKGEDLDKDYPQEYLDKYGPTYHLANAAWGIAALLEFYKTHPELDDREHSYLKPKRIGLDLDECLADFKGSYSETLKTKHPQPLNWSYCAEMQDYFNKWREIGVLDKFYLEIKPLCTTTEIGFEPICYITNRPVSSEISMKWLEKNHFPLKPVFTTANSDEKVKIALEQKLDYFIDDNYDTFVKMNKAGICCFLMNSSHNTKYEVGYKRISSFTDFKERFL